MARYALVIGIGENQPPLQSLTKTVGDAKAIAQVLRDHGDFHVELLTQPKQVQYEALATSIQTFVQQRAAGHEALIYFTGHAFPLVRRSISREPNVRIMPSIGDESVRGTIIMELESYFTVLSEDDIRLKGTRIGIETILYAYIHQKQSAEAIAQTFPQLALEQIYATILYYLQNRAKIEQYLTNWLNYCAEAERAQDENPPEIVLKLRELKSGSLAGANG